MKTWSLDFFMLINNDTYFSKCSNKVERHWNHHSWSSLQVWMPTNKNRQVDLIFQWHIRQSDEIQYVAEYLICYWPLSIRVRWFGPSEQKTHKIKTGHTYSYVKLNFRVGLFSCIFLFEAVFCCFFGILYLPFFTWEKRPK